MGLMIVSPVAWLGYSIPAMREKSWETWWKQLLTWGAITIPLFGLIYFVILFSQTLPQQVLQAAPALQAANVPSLGQSALQFIIGLLIIGIFVGGLMFIKSLSEQVYGWSRKGFDKTALGPGKWVSGLIKPKELKKALQTAITTPEEINYKATLVSDLTGLTELGPIYTPSNRYEEIKEGGNNPEIIANLTAVETGEQKQPEIENDRIINLKNI